MHPMTQPTDPSHKNWRAEAMGDAASISEKDISEQALAEEAVILVYGDNMFGDPVYSYIKFSLRNFIRMKDAMLEGESFKPSDYGEVLAAGRGDPSQELRDEMRIKYGLVDMPRSKKAESSLPAGLNQPNFFGDDEGY